MNFIENGGDEADTSDDNPDTVTFNYETNNVYVSRACGYKTVFQLDPTNPVEFTPIGTSWIQNIEVSQPNILNEMKYMLKYIFSFALVCFSFVGTAQTKDTTKVTYPGTLWFACGC